MALFRNFRSWIGWGGAIAETVGLQDASPSVALVEGAGNIGPDGALQISTVWSCIDRRASIVASLPFFVYDEKGGEKELARGSRLYEILHESPNSRMTPFEFWRAMMMNLDLRGNAYARIDRDSSGEALAMWPMPADQVEAIVLDDGSMIYKYQLGNDMAVLSDANVLHVKGLGNGTTGLAKLEFMRASLDEAAKAQRSASKIFGNGGKPTGVLMLDRVLNAEQRKQLQTRFAEMSEGNTSRLYVLEANMKYEQLSMSPEDQQLLETRKFSVEQICSWFDVPPVLVHHSNVTAWGTGIFEIKDGFYTLALGPVCENIRQAVRKRVMTPRQRVTQSAEMSIDALMRASIVDRFEIYAKATQNGLKTRNECRQLENDPPLPGGDVLTAQSNLLPLEMLGKQPAAPKEVPKEPILQHYRPESVEIKAENDRRHDDVLQILRAITEQPAPMVSLTNSFADAVVNVTRNETIEPPIVNVSNYVNPTPVDVRVTNEVSPTPVDVQANFEATIQPATVELTLPTRKTVGTVERNDKGEIIKTTTTEVNA